MGILSDIKQAESQLEGIAEEQARNNAAAERAALEAEERSAKLHRKAKKAGKALSQALEALFGRRVYLVLEPGAVEIASNIDDTWLQFEQTEVWTGVVEKVGSTEDKGAYLEFAYAMPDGEIRDLRVYTRAVAYGLFHDERSHDMDLLQLLILVREDATFRASLCGALDAQTLD